jgi:hypothetical protein
VMKASRAMPFDRRGRSGPPFRSSISAGNAYHAVALLVADQARHYVQTRASPDVSNGTSSIAFYQNGTRVRLIRRTIENSALLVECASIARIASGAHS